MAWALDCNDYGATSCTYGGPLDFVLQMAGALVVLGVAVALLGTWLNRPHQPLRWPSEDEGEPGAGEPERDEGAGPAGIGGGPPGRGGRDEPEHDGDHPENQIHTA